MHGGFWSDARAARSRSGIRATAPGAMARRRAGGAELSGALGGVLGTALRAAVVVGLGLGLTACSGASMPKETAKPTVPVAQPTPSLEVTPTPTPTAETDLEAAETVYKDYLKASFDVRVLDESTWDSVAPYVTASRLDVERAATAAFEEQGIEQFGAAAIVSIVQAQDKAEDPTSEIWLLACLDLREVSYGDGKGRVWTPDFDPDFLLTSIQMLRAEGAADWKVNAVETSPEDAECSPNL